MLADRAAFAPMPASKPFTVGEKTVMNMPAYPAAIIPLCRFPPPQLKTAAKRYKIRSGFLMDDGLDLLTQSKNHTPRWQPFIYWRVFFERAIIEKR